MKQLKSDEYLSSIYLTEVNKKDVMGGLNLVLKSPPPPPNSKGFAVIIDNVIPSEPVMDVFDTLPIPDDAKYLRKDTWVERVTDQENAFINSSDYFIVFFTNQDDIKKIEHVGIGTDRGDNELIDKVLDLLNDKFDTSF